MPKQAKKSLGAFLDCAGCAGETSAEFFNAASFNETGLSTSVEGVRLGGDFTLEQWVGLAVELDCFASVQRRARNEFGAGLLVENFGSPTDAGR